MEENDQLYLWVLCVDESKEREVTVSDYDNDHFFFSKKTAVEACGFRNLDNYDMWLANLTPEDLDNSKPYPYLSPEVELQIINSGQIADYSKFTGPWFVKQYMCVGVVNE